jgi:ATP-dependent Clp protease ATP-binding subunit ClpC
MDALEIKDKKIQVVKNQKYEEAAKLRDEEKKILKRLETEKEKWEEQKNNTRKDISEDMVFEVVSLMTKIPVSKLNTNEKESLLNLESSLIKSVIGQDEAVGTISRAIRRNRVGIKDPSRPIGSFIFLGSTGIGKCICGDSKITIRNKVNGEIKTIDIKDIIPDTH